MSLIILEVELHAYGYGKDNIVFTLHLLYRFVFGLFFLSTFSVCLKAFRCGSFSTKSENPILIFRKFSVVLLIELYCIIHQS